jgi:hypothetical protein
MSNITSATEEIEQLQLQIERLKERSLLELKVKLAEARHTVVILEKQIAEVTGKPATAPKTAIGRRPRTTISIAQVVSAIKGGATNFRAVSAVLGCSPVTVAKKIESEGKKVGIYSEGQKASFKLFIK